MSTNLPVDRIICIYKIVVVLFMTSSLVAIYSYELVCTYIHIQCK